MLLDYDSFHLYFVEPDTRLGRFEHLAPVGPSGYREDENEMQIDINEYKKQGKVNLKTFPEGTR